MTAVVVALAVVPPAFDVVKPSAFATDAAEAAITRAVATREAAVEGETDFEAVMAVGKKGGVDVEGRGEKAGSSEMREVENWFCRAK